MADSPPNKPAPPLPRTWDGQATNHTLVTVVISYPITPVITVVLPVTPTTPGTPASCPDAGKLQEIGNAVAAQLKEQNGVESVAVVSAKCDWLVGG